MEHYYFIFSILIALLVIAFILKNIFLEQKIETEAEIGMPYRLKHYFFNSSENSFFSILKERIDTKRFLIFPKVRLGDFIETTNSGDERWGSWNRIKSRHIDFIIWDKGQSKIVCGIEIDGKSHNSPKAQKNDVFKDTLFKTIGLPLHRIRVGSDFASQIDQISNSM